MKEEMFPRTRKPLHRWRWGGGQWGSFRAMEDSSATGVQKTKQTDSLTEDQCLPALTRLRGLSVHPPGRVGAGS